LDDRIRQLLKELGDAINESISTSESVNERIQRIRDEGYNLYVMLDATIGLGKPGEGEDEEASFAATEELKQTLSLPGADAQFRINVNDLAFLRSMGIDPTRKVRPPKKS